MTTDDSRDNSIAGQQDPAKIAGSMNGSSEESPEILTEDERIALRALRLSDSALIVRWRNNDRVRQNYIYQEKFTLEGQERYFHSKVETKEVFQFIILEKPSLRPVGSCVLSDYDPAAGQAECGVFIGEDDATGKRYAESALRLMNDYGFDRLGLSRIIARVFTDNIGSITASRRAGLRTIDTLPNVKRTDGSVKDMILIEITKDERDHG